MVATQPFRIARIPVAVRWGVKTTFNAETAETAEKHRMLGELGDLGG